MTNAPLPGKATAAWQVWQFLLDNPTKSLTNELIYIRFGIQQSQIATLLAGCIDCGQLVRGTNDDDELTYTAQPQALVNRSAATWAKVQATTQARAHEAGGAAPQIPRGKRARASDVDFSKIRIEKNIPLPPRVLNQANLFLELFKSLKLNESVEVPNTVTAYNAARSIKRLNLGLCTVRRSGEIMRVWKTQLPVVS
jgi:hypothetical protein